MPRGRVVAVEADHVGQREQPLRHVVAEVGPYADGQRLNGLRLPGPGERGLDQRQALAAHARIGRLVVQVPHDHAAVLAEGGHHALHVLFELRPRGAVGHHPQRRARHPLAVVDPRHGIGLRRGLGFAAGEVAVVQQDRHDRDAVFGRDVQEPGEPFPQPLGIRFPHDVVQKHPHRVEAQAAGPAQFAVDGRRIERLAAPHLDVVHRRAGQEIAAHQPRLGPVPRRRLAPWARRRGRTRARPPPAASAVRARTRQSERLSTGNNFIGQFPVTNGAAHGTVPGKGGQSWLSFHEPTYLYGGPGGCQRSRCSWLYCSSDMATDLHSR